MAAQAIQAFNPQVIQGLADEAPTEAQPHIADAHVAIRELEALRLNADEVAPAEVATMSEPLVALFRGEMTTGDDLRLPPIANNTGRAIRAAVDRLLAVDPHAVPFGDRNAVRKEEQMRALLRAFQTSASRIQDRAALGSEY